MSETNGFATAASILNGAGARRFDERTICGQKVRLRSITALEYADIEATLTRSAMEARGGNKQRQVRALADANIALITKCVVNGEGNPVFTSEHRSQLLEMDSAFSQALASACMEHCGVDAADLEQVAKNSSAVDGASSPTA